MLRRYTTKENGKRVELARVYTKDEHQINRGHIDSDALYIINKLKNRGYDTYIVGGAVRDLMIGKDPKDFDIATDARPGAIRKLFRNSRVIGKRFRLVHVFFNSKIIEVSTFRAHGDDQGANAYGVIEEDVKRRDFSLNALYYDPRKQIVVDYIGGVADIHHKKVNAVIPVKTIFKEDPVRMIRAIKYSVTTGFQMTGALKKAVKKDHKLIKTASTSRMTEEIFKILAGGYSASIFNELMKFKLLPHILPDIDGQNDSKALRLAMVDSLTKLDDIVRSHKEPPRSLMIQALAAPYLVIPDSSGKNNSTGVFKELYDQIKKLILPLTPPNREVEDAVLLIMKSSGFSLPKRIPRKRGFREVGDSRRAAKDKGRPRNRKRYSGGGKRKGPTSSKPAQSKSPSDSTQ